VGAFSGVENAKIWGSSPEMPQTGSPLAQGGLVVSLLKPPPLRNRLRIEAVKHF
jgi:hypothetical protein